MLRLSCSERFLYSLQFLKPLKASSNILASCLKVLKLCDLVTLFGRVQIPDGQRGSDALGHLVQKGVHSGHLSLVHHEPPSAVEGISIPVHHHVLHRGQESRSRGAGSHLSAGCYSTHKLKMKALFQSDTHQIILYTHAHKHKPHAHLTWGCIYWPLDSRYTCAHVTLSQSSLWVTLVHKPHISTDPYHMICALSTTSTQALLRHLRARQKVRRKNWKLEGKSENQFQLSVLAVCLDSPLAFWSLFPPTHTCTDTVTLLHWRRWVFPGCYGSMASNDWLCGPNHQQQPQQKGQTRGGEKGWVQVVKAESIR